jgi:endo-1,4-beta-xylanase
LIYNDYNLWKPEKRAGVVRLVKQLQANNVKIDAVGMQGHWNLTEPTLEEIEKSILAYHELGVQVLITELDITVLPNPWDLEGAEISQNFEGSATMNPYPEQLPDSVQHQLALRYQDIFKLFLKHRDKIDRVTFWGVNDGGSWLNGWPIRGRTNYPLLFDRDYLPKSAYDSIMALKK